MRVLQQISEHLLHAGELTPEAFERLIAEGFITTPERHEHEHDGWYDEDWGKQYVGLTPEELWERGEDVSSRASSKRRSRRRSASAPAFANVISDLMTSHPGHVACLERTDWPTSLPIQDLLDAVFFARALTGDPLSSSLLSLPTFDAPSSWSQLTRASDPVPRTALLRAPSLRQAFSLIRQGRALWAHLRDLHEHSPRSLGRRIRRERAHDLGWILGLEAHLTAGRSWVSAPYQAWAPQPSAALWAWAWREAMPWPTPTALGDYITAQARGLQTYRACQGPELVLGLGHLELLKSGASHRMLRHLSTRMLPVAVRLARPGVDP